MKDREYESIFSYENIQVFGNFPRKFPLIPQKLQPTVKNNIKILI